MTLKNNKFGWFIAIQSLEYGLEITALDLLFGNYLD